MKKENESKLWFFRNYLRKAAKFQQAYEMRHNPTPAEERMWEILKHDVMPYFPKHIFRRQWVAKGYILDFYCPTLQLAIEVDGDAHDDREKYDSRRDQHLRWNGIRVLRVRNEVVFTKSQTLAEQLCQIIQSGVRSWEESTRDAVFRIS